MLEHVRQSDESWDKSYFQFISIYQQVGLVLFPGKVIKGMQTCSVLSSSFAQWASSNRVSITTLELSWIAQLSKSTSKPATTTYLKPNGLPVAPVYLSLLHVCFKYWPHQNMPCSEQSMLPPWRTSTSLLHSTPAHCSRLRATLLDSFFCPVLIAQF